MQIVRDLGGYSWGRSDLVRRAMSKKKHDVMARERECFIHGIVEDGQVVVPGAVRNGVSAKTANKIFDEMMDFASYAFNKSHAAAYAVVAYRTAYLRLYYPVEFMTALINSFLGFTEKITEYIYSCKGRGIQLLPPDINRSSAHFAVEGGNIRFGLAAIRNVGENLTQSVIAEREAHGPYRDFFDFTERTEGLNKRMLEGLIKAGCFDSTGAKRSQLLAVYEQAIDLSASERKRKETGQLSLFDLTGAEDVAQEMRIPLPNIPEFDNRAMLSMEKESIGIYLSGHPLLEYDAVLKRLGVSASMLSEADDTGVLRDNARVRIGGIITSMRGKPTRSGSGIMGYGVLEDLTGSVEIAAFPSIYIQYGGLLQADKMVIIAGKLNIRDEQPNTLLVDEVTPLDAVQKPEKLYLRLQREDDALFTRICDTLRSFPGNIPVILHYEDTRRTTAAPKSMYVQPAEALMQALTALLGENNVKMK